MNEFCVHSIHVHDVVGASCNLCTSVNDLSVRSTLVHAALWGAVHDFCVNVISV